MIEVRNLTKYYGAKPAIQDVNFTVQKGEILGFLGPNGAGKTTAMKIITCYMPPTSGSVTVGGLDVFKDSLQVRRKLGYLPEENPLYKDMRVRDYLEFSAAIKTVPSGERADKVNAAIDSCGIREVETNLIKQCSKGYKQRIGLAAAIVNEPEILILDEPTVGLDPKQIIEIRSLIKQLSEKSTIILCTHILPEVQSTCERVIIINKGHIIAEDSVEHLMQSLRKSQQFELLVDGPPDKVAASLKKMNGIQKISAAKLNDKENKLMLEVEKDLDIRRDISSTIVNNGWGLLEFKSIGMSLEDIFLELVTEEEIEVEMTEQDEHTQTEELEGGSGE